MLFALVVAALAGPPATPPPAAGPAYPPPAWVETSTRSGWMGYGSFCWTAPDRTSTLCADSAAPQDRKDVPVLRVSRRQRLTFHLGFEPRSVGLTRFPSGRSIDLPAASVTHWRVRGRPRTLSLSAYPREGGGDASYLIRLRVRR